MKILFVSDNAKLSNPFVETLIAGLYEFNLDCTASIKEWWANVEEYDIIHFQWPEIVFYWNILGLRTCRKWRCNYRRLNLWV